MALRISTGRRSRRRTCPFRHRNSPSKYRFSGQRRSTTQRSRTRLLATPTLLRTLNRRGRFNTARSPKSRLTRSLTPHAIAKIGSANTGVRAPNGRARLPTSPTYRTPSPNRLECKNGRQRRQEKTREVDGRRIARRKAMREAGKYRRFRRLRPLYRTTVTRYARRSS